MSISDRNIPFQQDPGAQLRSSTDLPKQAKIDPASLNARVQAQIQIIEVQAEVSRKVAASRFPPNPEQASDISQAGAVALAVDQPDRKHGVYRPFQLPIMTKEGRYTFSDVTNKTNISLPKFQREVMGPQGRYTSRADNLMKKMEAWQHAKGEQKDSMYESWSEDIDTVAGEAHACLNYLTDRLSESEDQEQENAKLFNDFPDNQMLRDQQDALHNATERLRAQCANLKEQIAILQLCSKTEDPKELKLLVDSLLQKNFIHNPVHFARIYTTRKSGDSLWQNSQTKEYKYSARSPGEGWSKISRGQEDEMLAKISRSGEIFESLSLLDRFRQALSDRLKDSNVSPKSKNEIQSGIAQLRAQAAARTLALCTIDAAHQFFMKGKITLFQNLETGMYVLEVPRGENPQTHRALPVSEALASLTLASRTFVTPDKMERGDPLAKGIAKSVSKGILHHPQPDIDIHLKRMSSPSYIPLPGDQNVIENGLFFLGCEMLNDERDRIGGSPKSPSELAEKRHQKSVLDIAQTKLKTILQMRDTRFKGQLYSGQQLKKALKNRRGWAQTLVRNNIDFALVQYQKLLNESLEGDPDVKNICSNLARAIQESLEAEPAAEKFDVQFKRLREFANELSDLRIRSLEASESDLKFLDEAENIVRDNWPITPDEVVELTQDDLNKVTEAIQKGLYLVNVVQDESIRRRIADRVDFLVQTAGKLVIRGQKKLVETFEEKWVAKRKVKELLQNQQSRRVEFEKKQALAKVASPIERARILKDKTKLEKRKIQRMPKDYGTTLTPMVQALPLSNLDLLALVREENQDQLEEYLSGLSFNTMISWYTALNTLSIERSTAALALSAPQVNRLKNALRTALMRKVPM